MVRQPLTVHPVVTKLFVDVVNRLVPELQPEERDTSPLPALSNDVPFGTTDPQSKLPRLTHEDAHKLLCLAEQLTHRDDLGVLAAEAAEPGHYELVEVACRTQGTLGAAIDTLAPLASLLHGGLQLKLERGVELSRIAIRLAPGLALHPAACDFIIVSLGIAGRRQTARPEIRPTRVFLPYPQPAGTCALARVLDVPLEFGAPCLAMEFPTAHLALPLVRADGALGKVLRESVEQLLLRAVLDEQSPLERSVRERLHAGLPLGAADARSIARQLHMSERTLRRRLEAEGLSLRELTDQVRHVMALSLLAQPDISTDAVASQLGFAASQALHRAFRRWTGETIQAYRSRCRGH